MSEGPINLLQKPIKQQELIKICDDYLQDRWFTDYGYETVSVSMEKVWTYSEVDRSWRFHIQCLKSVNYLTLGYKVTGKTAYLQKALEIINSWNAASKLDKQSDMLWHDHATALRLLSVSIFYYVWKETDLYDAKIETMLIEISHSHVIKLLDDKFYMKNHNHGLDQDIALYVAATVFIMIDDAMTFKEIALRRLQAQIEFLFFKEGSYREHTPHYVYLLLDRLYGFLTFIKEDEIQFAIQLQQVLTEVTKYFLYSLHPDGSIAMIGDGEHDPLLKLHISEWLIQPDYLKETLLDILYKREVRHQSQLPLDIYFKEAGQVILRNQWDCNENTVQIIVTSCFHSRVHKHHDDLSFILFAKEKPIFIDSGKYNYEYKSSPRQYIVSQPAHNTVMIDDLPTELQTLNIGKSGILSTFFGKNVSYISAVHALYKDIVHRRLYIFIKPDILLVVDKIDGYKEHKLNTFFNINPSILCVKDIDQYVGYIENEEVFEIANVYCNEQFTTFKTRGEIDNLKGWSSTQKGKLVPNTVIEYEHNTKNLRAVYQISLGNSIGKKVHAIFENNTVNISVNKLTIKVVLTDYHEHLFINDKYYITEKIFHSKLIEALLKV